MQGGMVVEIGTHETLIERKGRYFQLVQSQADLISGVGITESATADKELTI